MNMRFLPLLLVILFPSVAKADYYVWQDPKTGMSLTMPDTWKRQNNVNPDTLFTAAGPSNVDQPMCRVDVMDDKRYTIFPARYGDAIQKVAVSTEFWRAYMRHYDSYTVERIYDGAGLGRWFASYALASYVRMDGTVLEQRRAIMFASLYNDKLYVVECSALNHAYEKWAADFRGIIKSVDFKKAYHEVPTGEYQNFLNNAETYFWAQTAPDGTTAY